MGGADTLLTEVTAILVLFGQDPLGDCVAAQRTRFGSTMPRMDELTGRYRLGHHSRRAARSQWFPLACAMLLFLAACAAQADPQPPSASTTILPADPRLQALRRQIAEAVADASPVSISIAVAHRGEIVWQEAFGWADLAERTRATPATTYPVASVLKPFTAARGSCRESSPRRRLDRVILSGCRSGSRSSETRNRPRRACRVHPNPYQR